MTVTSSRALRIGIDGRELEGRPTGVGRYLRSLLRRFAENGRHTFTVYSASAVSLPMESRRIATRVLSGGHPLLFEQRTLPSAVEQDGMDVLLSPAYSCPLLGRIPKVTALHDLSFFARREEFGLLHGLRRRVMARASASVSHSILACSNFTQSEIQRHLGSGAARKTAVVLLGPDDDLPPSPDRAKSRLALNLPPDATYIITVGTVFRRRNVDVLIRAVSRLKAQRTGVRLGIIGDNRSHPFEDLNALGQSLGLGSSLVISGFVTDDEVARHYAAADLAVFLSDYEGFGLPALEAMSRGVPTVIADRGSLNELFAEGAHVVEPEEAEVAAALTRLMESPARCEELRGLGRERARVFSWEKAASETLHVLERAAS